MVAGLVPVRLREAVLLGLVDQLAVSLLYEPEALVRQFSRYALPFLPRSSG